MTDLRKAAEMALEALEGIHVGNMTPMAEENWDKAIQALRQALDHVPDTMKMLEPDMGIDRGAWDDVPDATKWVDELRGGDETEQEPVAYLDAVDSKTVYVAPNRKRWLDPHEDKEWLQFHYDHPHDTPLYTTPVSKPDDLLRQSEQEGWRWAKECEAEVKRLRTLLAKDEQEPVAWLEYDDEGYLFLSGKRKSAFPVFTAPPSNPEQGCGECAAKASDGYALYCVKCVEPMFKKEWVSLTDEDFDNIYNRHDTYDSFARAIEAALRSKNNG